MATNKTAPTTQTASANVTEHTNPVLPLTWGTMTLDKIVVCMIANPAPGKDPEKKRVSLGQMAIPAPYPFDSLTIAGKLIEVVKKAPELDSDGNPLVPDDDISLYEYSDARMQALHSALLAQLKANAFLGTVKGNGSKAKPVVHADIAAAIASVSFDTKGDLPGDWEALNATTSKITGAMQRKLYEACLAAWLQANPMVNAIGAAVESLTYQLEGINAGMPTMLGLSNWLKRPMRPRTNETKIENLRAWLLDKQGITGLVELIQASTDSASGALYTLVQGAVDLASAQDDEDASEDDSEF